MNAMKFSTKKAAESAVIELGSNGYPASVAGHSRNWSVLVNIRINGRRHVGFLGEDGKPHAEKELEAA